MQWSINIVWLLFLWVIGIIDIRSLSVSKKNIILGSVLTLVSIYIEKLSLGQILSGVMIGCIFILVSKFTKEALGYGDSMIISLVCMKYGGYLAIYVLGGAFAMAAIYGGVSEGRKGSVAFLPFLAMACTLCTLL